MSLTKLDKRADRARRADHRPSTQDQHEPSAPAARASSRRSTRRSADAAATSSCRLGELQQQTLDRQIVRRPISEPRGRTTARAADRRAGEAPRRTSPRSSSRPADRPELRRDPARQAPRDEARARSIDELDELQNDRRAATRRLDRRGQIDPRRCREEIHDDRGGSSRPLLAEMQRVDARASASSSTLMSEREQKSSRSPTCRRSSPSSRSWPRRQKTPVRIVDRVDRADVARSEPEPRGCTSPWCIVLSLGAGDRPGLPARAHRPLGEGARAPDRRA